jgi:hypothetical protein
MKPRDIDPRKAVIATMLVGRRNMSAKAVCQEMDRLRGLHPKLPKYWPVPEWRVWYWCNAYSQVRNRVEVYIAKIRRDPTRYLLNK